MQLLYFDLDHGVERLLFLDLQESSRTVEFRFEKGPDPTYEDEGPEVPVVSVRASTECADLDQFFGFCRALIAAMRETPFHLQDPSKIPLSAMPHADLVLYGFGDGVQTEELSSRIPPEIVAEILPSDRVPERFRPLVRIAK